MQASEGAVGEVDRAYADKLVDEHVRVAHPEGERHLEVGRQDRAADRRVPDRVERVVDKHRLELELLDVEVGVGCASESVPCTAAGLHGDDLAVEQENLPLDVRVGCAVEAIAGLAIAADLAGLLEATLGIVKTVVAGVADATAVAGFDATRGAANAEIAVLIAKARFAVEPEEAAGGLVLLLVIDALAGRCAATEASVFARKLAGARGAGGLAVTLGALGPVRTALCVGGLFDAVVAVAAPVAVVGSARRR